MDEPPRFNERVIVFLVGAVQFINILDFVMVMPLGPDFARALDIPESQLGLIAGSYTAAAAVSGFVGSYFLDRFDRRPALGVAMLGLVAGTAAGGIARDLYTLMAARVIAGLFGGPATSLSLSIVADVVPVERRGKAMGAVMGALSVATVVGVPAGLWLAQGGRWWLPFFSLAALGVVVTAATIVLLPSLTIHLRARTQRPSLGKLLGQSIVRRSYTMTAAAMCAGFLVIPNIPAYLLKNLSYPRSHFDRLYLIGGAVSFFALRGLGPLVDRFGSFAVGSAGVAAMIAVFYVGFLHYAAWLPVPVFFVAYMVALSSRNVAYNTLTSKVPRADERARFMSLQSTVGHASSALAAIVSSALLSTAKNGALVGMSRVVLISIALTAILPALLRTVERAVARRA